jgi:hypothetical protein
VDPVSLSAVDTKRFADAKPPTVSGAFRELGGQISSGISLSSASPAPTDHAIWSIIGSD